MPTCPRCNKPYTGNPDHCSYCNWRFISVAPPSKAEPEQQKPTVSALPLPPAPKREYQNFKKEIFLRCSNGYSLRARDGFVHILTNHTEESLPVSSIVSVTIKYPGAISMGKISFATAQAATGNLYLGFGVSTAVGAERTYFFSRENQSSADGIKYYVMHYVNAMREEAEVKQYEETVRAMKNAKAIADAAAPATPAASAASAAPAIPATPAPTADPASVDSPASVIAVADELRALKNLLDDGIIDQADFVAKKKALLGL